jgi:hypothetical protein
VLDEEGQGLGLPEREAEPVQFVAALEQAPDDLGRAPRLPSQARDLRLLVRLADGQLLACGDGLQ